MNSHLVSLRKESTSLYWFGLCLGAVVFAMTPVFTVGIPLPAFWLPRKLLDRHASRIVHSKSYMIRQAVNLVQLNAGLCWGRDDRIRARFNLDPLSLPLDMLSGRLPGGGVQLMERLNEFRDIAIWVQVGRAESVGSIHAGLTGRPVVKYTLNQSDMHRFREGMYKTEETHIAAGAHSVLPAIYGLPYRLGRDEIQKIREAPLDPRNYVGVVSHLFGGCVMGGDPSRS